MTALSQGLVIAHLGQGIAVEVGEEILLCQTLRKLETLVVGDQVLIARPAPDSGRIEQLLPRRSVLLRPGRGTLNRAVVANIDTLFVVLAVQPEPDFLLLDQYLAVCENNNIDAALILNKIDLPCSAIIEQELDYYQSLGYKFYPVSTILNQGIDSLLSILTKQSSLFAGQSGVGKSSLTNALLPDKNLRINSISATTGHGRHTTTAATLYHLPDGGNLIDSPGVAIFGLAGLSENQIAWGYREFQPFFGQCRFNDCRHINDPDCAIRTAVEAGTIAKNRYQRFLKLLDKMPPAQRRK